MNRIEQHIVDAVDLLFDDNQIIRLSGEPDGDGWRSLLLARVIPDSNFVKGMSLLREALKELHEREIE